MKVNRDQIHEFMKDLGNEVLFENYDDAFRRVLDDTHVFMRENFEGVDYYIQCDDANNPIEKQREGILTYDLYVKDEDKWFLLSMTASKKGIDFQELVGQMGNT